MILHQQVHWQDSPLSTNFETRPSKNLSFSNSFKSQPSPNSPNSTMTSRKCKRNSPPSRKTTCKTKPNPPRMEKLGDLQLDNQLKHLEALHTELSSTTIPSLSQLHRNVLECRNVSEANGNIAVLEKTVEKLKNCVTQTSRP